MVEAEFGESMLSMLKLGSMMGAVRIPPLKPIGRPWVASFGSDGW